MVFIPDNNKDKADHPSQQEALKEGNQLPEENIASETPLDLLKQGRKPGDMPAKQLAIPELTLSGSDKSSGNTNPSLSQEKIHLGASIKEATIPGADGFMTRREHYDIEGQLTRTDIIAGSYQQREYYDANGNTTYRNTAYANGDRIIEVFQENEPMCLSIITGSLCQTTYRTGKGRHLCSVSDDGTQQTVDYELPDGRPMRHESNLTGYSSVQLRL